ncbi:MAG: hypothetical protein KJZ83_11935 [Burkholderiaceae bacterium]|nr:hypothetical protein [Burkholderiaceae bacterium]
MQIATLPAASGRRWAVEGFRLLGRNPIPLLAITFMYLIMLMATTLIPLLGPFAPMLVTPVMSVGVMHAVRAADRGETPTPQMLFAGFRDRGGLAWPLLLVLGGVNAAATLATLALASLADGGTLLQIATGTIQADDPGLADTSLVYASLVFLVVYAPLQAALWYAPLFVAWHGIAPLKALFFSFAGVMRNKGAFFAYVLTWFAVAFAASLLVQALKLAFGATPMLMSAILSPLSLVVLSALYCSFWPSYRDAVLGEEDHAPG